MESVQESIVATLGCESHPPTAQIDHDAYELEYTRTDSTWFHVSKLHLLIAC